MLNRDLKICFYSDGDFEQNVRGTENVPKTPRKQGFYLPCLPQQFLKVSVGFSFHYFKKMLPGLWS